MSDTNVVWKNVFNVAVGKGFIINICLNSIVHQNEVVVTMVISNSVFHYLIK